MDLNLLQRETALPLETVRTRWRQLSTLPAEQRGLLDPAALASSWKVTMPEVLDFLWACVLARGLVVRWQRVSPESGWVVDEAEKPQDLSPRAVHDPFSGKPVPPDLGQGTRAVFSLNSEAYSGSWMAYARCRQSGVELLPQPTWSKTLQAWEVGRLDIEVEEGDVYQLVCLENRATLELTVDSAKVIGGRSFIGKMKQYRAQKFLLSLQRRVIDLKILPEGFLTEQTLIAPGQLVYWLENQTDQPVVLQVWKAQLPAAVPAFPSGVDLRHCLGLPAFRRYWSQLGLANDLRRLVTGLVCLRADFEPEGSLFHDWDDERSYRELESAFERTAASVTAHGGFVNSRHDQSLIAAFVSVAAALEATLELRARALGSGTLAHPVLSLSAGPVLVVNEGGVPVLFGDNLHLTQVLQREAQAGELWLSLGVLSSEGSAERLAAAGLEAHPQMLRAAGVDQKVLAYRISPSSPA